MSDVMVVVTHMHHFDHFDGTARNAIPKDKPVFTQSENEAEDMCKFGFKDVTALKDDGLLFGEITLFRTDAAHGQGEAADNNYKAFGIPSGASCVVVKAAPAAAVIASHLDAVNHARIGRTELQKFVEENNLSNRVHIPEDGEIFSL